MTPTVMVIAILLETGLGNFILVENSLSSFVNEGKLKVHYFTETAH